MVKPIRRPSRKDSAFLKNADHALLWNLVEGAVADAFRAHPDFLTNKGRSTVVRSVTKRVVGQLVGYAKQTLRRSRFGDCSGKGINKARRNSESLAEGDSDRGDQTPPDRPDLNSNADGIGDERTNRNGL